MKRNWLIGIAVILGIFLLGIVLKTKVFNKGALAAVSITTNPKAVVFIDGNKVGNTPYFNDEIQSGEHTVKLEPEATTDNLTSWEGKVTLNSNVLTVINRNLGPTTQTSSGEVIWLEKAAIKKDKSSLTVISVPDQAVVKVGGEPKGFSPITIDELNPGNYQITVNSPGYEERTVSTNTVAGYKLIVNIQLAKKIEGIEEATDSGEKAETTPTPIIKVSPTPKTTSQPTTTYPEKPYIKIKETPTGWLRVRTEPSASTTEAAKVNPGEMFPYLGEEKNGWYKIEYEKDKEGWVNGTYVELIE